MSDTEIELGPIDWVIVEWPPGTEPNGKGLDMIVDLTERGIIRVLDIAFVRKNEDGSVCGGGDRRLRRRRDPRPRDLRGRVLGRPRTGGLRRGGQRRSRPGASAAILVYENTWAAPFATNLRKTGARLVDSGRIPINEFIAALDELEAAEA